MSHAALLYPEERIVDADTLMTWAHDAYANGEIDRAPQDLEDAIALLEDAGEITVRASCKHALRHEDGPPLYDAATSTGMYDRD